MIYCFLADGFEEIEALATVDIIRRAGLDLKTVGIGDKVICGAHGIKVECDIAEAEVVLDENLKAVILPGGMPGTLNLENNCTVQSAIDFAFKKSIYLCAICAAPLILGHKGILRGKSAIAYPGFEKELEGAYISENHVVCDDVIITAKGAGVAVDFALEIVSALCGKDTSEKIREAIQCV